MTDKFRRRVGNRPALDVHVTTVAAPPGVPGGARNRAYEIARIAGSISQVLMLFVVAGGYWFTVRPVLENQLLQERNAQLQLEIIKNEELLSSVDERISQVVTERDAMLSELELEQDQKDELSSALRSLEGREMELRSRVAASQSELASVSAKLRGALWELFYSDMLLKALPGWLYYNSLMDPNDWSEDKLNILVTGEPDPYQNIRDAIVAIRDDRERYPDYPEDFFEVALRHLESRKAYLQCDFPDTDKLQAEYTERYARLGPEIEKQLQARLEEHRAEAAKEGHGIRFTDEFVLVTRRGIELNEKVTLQNEFSNIVIEASKVCADKRSEVVREFAGLQ